MKVLSVVGARPQFVKLAPVSHAFSQTEHEHVIVHTGQHYDVDLSDVFFSGLGIPPAKAHLGVGSGTHGVQTGAMMMALDPLITAEEPDCILVYGDTNTTLAASLVAVKQHIALAHLEAGLRSFNRRMPEEHNRIVADHCADLLLAPSTRAMEQLAVEGLALRSVLVGDVMVDVCLRTRDLVLRDEIAPVLPDDLVGPYLVATLHRPDNTDDPERLAVLLDALGDAGCPVLLLAHPRLQSKAAQFGLSLERGGLRAWRPLPYAELVTTVLGSDGVITDSGGLQKEAFLLRRPCTTIRSETEWPETMDGGWNVLVEDPRSMVSAEWRATLNRRPTGPATFPYGRGDTASRVVAALTGPSVTPGSPGAAR